ncbi:MAG: fasciclin domain-containing protein [Mucilaginibacter sp.]
MNKLFLSSLLLLTTCTLFAQVAPSTPKSIAEASVEKPVDVKGADPKTGMVSSYLIGDNIFLSKMGGSFYKAVKAAGMEETFKSRGPITLFLPNDQAFAKLSKGKIDSLYKPALLPHLIALIAYHAIPGNLRIDDLADKIDRKTGIATFTTLSGSKLYIKFDGNYNLVIVDDAGHQSIITQPQLPQSNGFIYVIDTVLQPKDKLL